MKKKLKTLLPVEFVRTTVEFKYNNFPTRIIRDWEQNGSPAPPPPPVKHKLIKDIQKEYNYNVLVETGTYLGYMISAQKHNFEKIYSIELSEDLYRRAYKKFEKYNHIKIIHGDSGEKLTEVLKDISEPAIFWLDGHYSGGITAKGSLNCPIWKELEAIFSNRLDHIILIDDARDFQGVNDYPNIKEIETYILGKNTNYSVTIVHDIIVAKL